MTQKKRSAASNKPKRSLFDHLINIICVLILIGALVYEYKHFRSSEAAMASLQSTAQFEKHMTFTWAPPFAMPYYVLKPSPYNPEYSYPLVLVLHGVTDYAHAARFMGTSAFMTRYPAFVVVPYMSKRSVWAAPDNERFQLPRRGLRFPDALPQAVSIVRKMQQSYPIDADRIYVTGHSGGALGVYGAAKDYADVFAAGLAVSGMWDPMDAPYMTGMPLIEFHGVDDTQIPPQSSEMLMKNISDIGGAADFVPMVGGHDIWRQVYAEPKVWDWLFEQSR